MACCPFQRVNAVNRRIFQNCVWFMNGHVEGDRRGGRELPTNLIFLRNVIFPARSFVQSSKQSKESSHHNENKVIRMNGSSCIQTTIRQTSKQHLRLLDLAGSWKMLSFGVAIKTAIFHIARSHSLHLHASNLLIRFDDSSSIAFFFKLKEKFQRKQSSLIHRSLFPTMFSLRFTHKHFKSFELSRFFPLARPLCSPRRFAYHSSSTVSISTRSALGVGSSLRCGRVHASWIKHFNAQLSSSSSSSSQSSSSFGFVYRANYSERIPWTFVNAVGGVSGSGSEAHKCGGKLQNRYYYHSTWDWGFWAGTRVRALVVKYPKFVESSKRTLLWCCFSSAGVVRSENFNLQI